LADPDPVPQTQPPPLTGVLETVLYFTDAERTERFYSDVLGMRLLAKDEEGRNLFFRAGESVFLLFDASVTERGGSLPPHGARGEVHTCFVVSEEVYETWKTYLAGQGIEILQEVTWPRGLSFYFRDPDGNLLEIANADIWPP
jgi:catechol 2,3-dioxygenase-like lactoylglutathione lyase family enzyme